MLADDFESAAFLSWPSHAGLDVKEGRAVFDAAAPYASLRSGYYYDLRDSALTIDPVVNGPLGPQDWVSLALYAADDRYVEWILVERTLIARVWDLGGKSDLIQVPYDPVLHASWRIVEDRGTLRFEAGPIGGPYAMLASVQSPAWVGYMKAHVSVLREAGSLFEVALDSVNGGISVGAPCLVQYLKDDFSTASLGDQWKRSASEFGAITVMDEALVVTPEPSQMGEMYVRASAMQDLREGRVFVEIPEMVDTQADTQYLQLTVFTLDNKYVNLIQRKGALRWTTTGDVQVGFVPYSPTEHRWWQIREEAGTVYWETSADGVDFQLLGSMGGVEGLDRVGIELSLRTFAAPAPGRAVIDNVNRSP